MKISAHLLSPHRLKAGEPCTPLPPNSTMWAISWVTTSRSQPAPLVQAVLEPCPTSITLRLSWLASKYVEGCPPPYLPVWKMA